MRYRYTSRGITSYGRSFLTDGEGMLRATTLGMVKARVDGQGREGVAMTHRGGHWVQSRVMFHNGTNWTPTPG